MDLEPLVELAQNTSADEFAAQLPYPHLLYARTQLWDRGYLKERFLLRSKAKPGSTTMVAYDTPSEGGIPAASCLVKRKQNTSDEGIVLGRATTNDIVVPVGSVSSMHASFSPPSTPTGAWTLTDLESSNHTFLGNQRLAAFVPTPVADRTHLRFGSNLVAWFVMPKTLWGALRDPTLLEKLIELA